MATATAFVLVGSTHPNDNGINPQWLLELWEGNVARWTARHLESIQDTLKSEPSSPDDIGPALIRFISQLIPDSTVGVSIVISALEDSSMLRQLSCLDALQSFDVHVLVPRYTRTFNSWSGEWRESGSIRPEEIED